MKRTMGWIAGCSVALGLVVWLTGIGRASSVASAAKKDAETPAAAPAPTTAPEHIVFTFDGAGTLEEFTSLWQQRQTLILRMTALQSYWNQDQAALGQLNEKISSTYKVDPSKNYFLDRERRVLVERAGTSQAPSAPTAGLPAPDEPAKP